MDSGSLLLSCREEPLCSSSKHAIPEALSFSLHCHSLCPIHSGSSKTCLLKLLSGRARPDSGSLLFNGQPLSSLQPQRVVGFSQQTSFHLPALTVRETVEYACNFTRADSLYLMQVRSDSLTGHLMRLVFKIKPLLYEGFIASEVSLVDPRIGAYLPSHHL